MIAEGSGSDTSGSSQRNDLLRRARLRTPSPNGHTRPMSQRELAEAVTAHVFRQTEPSAGRLVVQPNPCDTSVVLFD